MCNNPIKIKKVNIGTEQTPKLANVGDYWDDATISNIIELLHEYQDLFPTKFTDMKGIKGPMGEMKIPLRLDARAIKQIPNISRKLRLSWIECWKQES
jgi:hypothetical protein